MCRLESFDTGARYYTVLVSSWLLDTVVTGVGYRCIFVVFFPGSSEITRVHFRVSFYRHQSTSSFLSKPQISFLWNVCSNKHTHVSKQMIAWFTTLAEITEIIGEKSLGTCVKSRVRVYKLLKQYIFWRSIPTHSYMNFGLEVALRLEWSEDVPFSWETNHRSALWKSYLQPKSLSEVRVYTTITRHIKFTTLGDRKMVYIWALRANLKTNCWLGLMETQDLDFK